MNPFYFGSSQRPLYGVYHPAKARTARPIGVVLCYPLGQEYMRAHRAFRQLATLLTKSGFPVLRFDYAGTGDSAGDGTAGSVATWIEDIGAAIDELKDTAGVGRVSLVGLRAGGALVALAQRGRKDVERVVLWDPTADAQAYVASLLAGGDAPDESGTVGVQGFPLTTALRGELAAIDLGELDPASSTLCVVISEERAEFARLRECLAARRVPAVFRCYPSAGNWNEVDRWGSALLPQAIIQGIVQTLTEERVA